MKINDTPTTVQAVPNTDTSTSSGIALFQPQAVSTQQLSLSSPDVSPVVEACPKTQTIAYPPAEYRQLCQQNTEQKFLLWLTLHHLKSLQTPPPLAGGEFDLTMRRVLHQTARTPPNFDENSSFEQIVSELYDLHVRKVTQFPSTFYFRCMCRSFFNAYVNQYSYMCVVQLR